MAQAVPRAPYVDPKAVVPVVNIVRRAAALSLTFHDRYRDVDC